MKSKAGHHSLPFPLTLNKAQQCSVELIIKIAQTKPKLAAILSLSLLLFFGRAKNFYLWPQHRNRGKILCLLTKYLIKQKYVAAKSTQKANVQRERERNRDIERERKFFAF